MPEPDLARPTPDEPTSAGISRGVGDRIFRLACTGATLSIMALVLGLLLMLVWGSWPILTDLDRYGVLTSADWDPTGKPPQFGALGMIYGTLMTSLIAMLLAVPLGVACAAYLSEIASGVVRRTGAFLVELLAAIPSVIYGFWGIAIIAPLVKWMVESAGGDTTTGKGILASGIVLALMILPYITAIAYDVCQAVPSSQRQGSLALGATRWQTIWTAVLPYARPGIITGSFLALGRALGETMAVTMLIGGRSGEIENPITGLGDSLASMIASSVKENSGETHWAALITLGLILFMITGITNIMARYLIGRQQRRFTAPPAPSEINGETPGVIQSVTPPRERLLAGEWAMAAQRRARRKDRIMTGVLTASLVLATLPLFLILSMIVYEGLGALEPALFTEDSKYRGAEADGFARGLGHSMLGSLLMVGLATLIAVPVSLTVAVFLVEYPRHPLARPARFLTEQLAGVPSIVIGLFGYALLVAPLGGFSGWAGVFALGVMMLPIVIRSSEEAMKLVPTGLRQASYALGATQWQTVRWITLPAARSAIITGVFLAIGRIAGETAPLLLTALGYSKWTTDLSRETPFLTGDIFYYATGPDPFEQQQAWAAALVLVTFVMTLNVGIRLVSGSRAIAASRAD